MTQINKNRRLAMVFFLLVVASIFAPKAFPGIYATNWLYMGMQIFLVITCTEYTRLMATEEGNGLPKTPDEKKRYLFLSFVEQYDHTKTKPGLDGFSDQKAWNENTECLVILMQLSGGNGSMMYYKCRFEARPEPGNEYRAVRTYMDDGTSQIMLMKKNTMAVAS